MRFFEEGALRPVTPAMLREWLGPEFVREVASNPHVIAARARFKSFFDRPVRPHRPLRLRARRSLRERYLFGIRIATWRVDV